MEYTLRPYQQECVDLLDHTDTGRHLVALSVGLGKTVIFSHLKRTGRTLILSHRDELVRQPQKYYDCSYGIEKAEETSNGEEVVSASVQSLSTDSRLSRFAPDEFDTIIVDEAHHAAAPTYKKILKHFSGVRRVFGFTATPKRGDNVRLDDVFDDIIFEHDLRWGIENRFLSRIRCKLVNGEYTLDGVKKTAGDYNMSDLDKNMNSPETISLVAKVYMENCHQKGKHTLVYCVNKKSCLLLMTAIRSLIPDEAEKIQMVTGETPDEERKEILEKFSAGDVKCIINCMVLTEGTDMPICDAILNFRPTCNASLYTQIVGRGTRLYKGKEYCLVIDVIPTDGEQRNLCTAPTLFGVDPTQMDKKAKKEFDEDKDLIEQCDLLRGSVCDISQKLQYVIENVNRMIESTEQALNESRNVKEYVTAKASWLKDNSELDVKGMLVRETMDEEKAYAIYPNYSDRIYLSKPDVLGKTKIFFELTKVNTFRCEETVNYNGELPWDEAIELAYSYCMMMPDYYRYCWDKSAAERWANMACTEKQVQRITRDLKAYDLDTSDAKTISKLDASLLIDQMSTLRDQQAYMKEISCSPNAKQSTKEKKKKLFEEEEKEKKEQEERGKAMFQGFKAQILDARAKIEMRRQEEDKKLESMIKSGSYQVRIRIFGAKNAPASERQISYLNGLIVKSEENGFMIPDTVKTADMDGVRVSSLISILKTITDNLPKLPAPVTLVNLEEVIANVYQEKDWPISMICDIKFS